MKATIIRGGPGEISIALPAKTAWPRLDITVRERNSADDTLGFGVVFSDQTLDTLTAHDPVSRGSGHQAWKSPDQGLPVRGSR